MNFQHRCIMLVEGGFDMTIGERIKQRRTELNMSQDELAKKVGYKSRSSIQKIECARSLPLPKVEKMAYALDVSPSYLMGWQEVEEELARQTKPLVDAMKPVSEELQRLSKSLNGFTRTEKSNIVTFDSIMQKYDEEQIKRALEFVKAFLSATPERQKIAIEILQSHQSDS